MRGFAAWRFTCSFVTFPFSRAIRSAANWLASSGYYCSSQNRAAAFEAPTGGVHRAAAFPPVAGDGGRFRTAAGARSRRFKKNDTGEASRAPHPVARWALLQPAFRLPDRRMTTANTIPSTTNGETGPRMYQTDVPWTVDSAYSQ
jgi:hypothetical protein